MRFRNFLFFVCFLFSSTLFSQVTSSYPVYLIGDSGEDTVSGKALLMLQDELIAHPNSAVVFLGDNVYPSGLSADAVSASHLKSQLNILNNYKGHVYFIPGNHDWDAQAAEGLKKINYQEKYINQYLHNQSELANKDAAMFLPSGGLPGPASVMLNDKLRLIIIDTQWFLHRYKKNKMGTVKNTKKIFFARLDSLLKVAQTNNEQVVIAGHHPVFTNGQHSKSRQPVRFLINNTPFCVFGFAGLFRLYSQDLAQPNYKKMRNKILTIFNHYNNIVYASGHDHNIQCLISGRNRYVVSGSGSKLSKLRSNKKFDSLFQDDKSTGFVKVVFDSDGTHHTIVYRVGQEPKTIEGF